MIASPWDLILTVVFAGTGLYCLYDLARLRRAGAQAGLSNDEVVDINHIVMSAAMILMVWVAVADVVTWTQVVIFAILSVALVPQLVSSTADRRGDVIGHLALNAAMVWMLVAMPLLMAGMGGEAESGSGHHHGGATGGEMLAATPAWADGVNIVFAALSGAAALWWVIRAIDERRGHWAHFVCHAFMGAGMAAMLVVMNG